MIIDRRRVGDDQDRSGPGLRPDQDDAAAAVGTGELRWSGRRTTV